MDDRIKCVRCDRMILPVTARTNNGLCGHCRNRTRREKFDETVASWERDPTRIPGTHGIPAPADIALAITARAMREVHNESRRVERVCHDFFDAAHRKWCAQGAEALSPKERHVLAVETFYGEVTNGGLGQYLGNESHAFANWAAEGFEKIGIPELAELMRRVQALFPEATIPVDGDTCWKIVENLDGEVLEDIESVFWKRWSQDGTEIRRRLYAYVAEESPQA